MGMLIESKRQQKDCQRILDGRARLTFVGTMTLFEQGLQLPQDIKPGDRPKNILELPISSITQQFS